MSVVVFRDQNEVDVRAVYHQLMDTYVTTDSDGENEAGPSTSNASGARRYVYMAYDFVHHLMLRKSSSKFLSH